MGECHYGAGPHPDKRRRALVRARVRLTARDWRRIYDALVWLIEWSGEDDIEATPPTLKDCQIVLRKIGAGGMAAAKRGVLAAARSRR
jgi:hypothetical protein